MHNCLFNRLAIGICSLMLFSLAAGAGELPPPPAYDGAPVEGFVDLMARKFARGVMNVLTGVGEIPRQIGITSHEDGVMTGLTVGTLKGLFMGIVRTGAGGIEALTFFVPAPGFYDPILDPEFVWQSRMRYVAPDPQ